MKHPVVWFALVWFALGWMLAPVSLSAAEITLIHGASVTGPLPTTDVVVLRGAVVGGAVPVPDPVAAAEAPRIERRAAPEAPIVELHVTMHRAYTYDDRHFRGRALRHKRHHGHSSRMRARSSAKSRMRWDR